MLAWLCVWTGKRYYHPALIGVLLIDACTPWHLPWHLDASSADVLQLLPREVMRAVRVRACRLNCAHVAAAESAGKQGRASKGRGGSTQYIERFWVPGQGEGGHAVADGAVGFMWEGSFVWELWLEGAFWCKMVVLVLLLVVSLLVLRRRSKPARDNMIRSEVQHLRSQCPCLHSRPCFPATTRPAHTTHNPPAEETHLAHA